MTNLLLHDYWRSGAAYRVRIALNLKGLDYEAVAHDLRIGGHRAPDYFVHSAQRLIPALETGDFTLTQSLAIIEWLDEAMPGPKLVPEDTGSRAIVRAMAQLVACDIHPLNNLRVLEFLRTELKASPEQESAWITHWISEGFAAMEQLVCRYGGSFSHGDRPSIADCCLIPQIYSARRFSVDLTPYPSLVAIAEAAIKLEAFQLATPEKQPDAR
jgi:maleylpyruvate isomerase